MLKLLLLPRILLLVPLSIDTGLADQLEEDVGNVGTSSIEPNDMMIDSTSNP